ncbi:bifunctional [glutamine synthetase] adenylyltransferase/[glutamine synthetase]-adenylyl-L-tyrosine phosphorylase [Nitrospirillum viridazoti]|uniref:Bifunctional glutamine synthetase adenylyltransferase/adenylyl-removing enzyme n=1 Tax=Nitrospirillum viridazoti CBAmc TaxID=1441467 RepID=A0A248JTU2_9PROT|nr:bifunctional [glutamine synthetase] adenylyltransferase/[glutamine synthetase]-adenylyl-L-tyrosine phosphorylase [Nitrospirillum amazonense]ASG22152.1 bifunctional glutamine synthetase adenylyltransferase/deadenyltransferase [Nitrospirillum amazonense CBAmc]TWB32706.1 glutamate-ammonia-ligase adenylyltransferase [Nitrospirillum amazonense]
MFNAKSLPQAADTELLARGLESWQRRAEDSGDMELAEFARTYAADETGGALLRAILGNSPFLGQALLKEQAFFRQVATLGFDAAFMDLLEGLWAEVGGATTTDRLMKALRVAKRRAALLIAAADIAEAWTLEQVTGALSQLAEAALRLTARHLLRQLAAKGDIRLPDAENDPEAGSGLIVLAMGKFGALELNYSSDIDLIVLYDDGVVQARDPDEMTRTFVRLARDLVRIMEERTVDGYVFRTDLRLRPDPGATPLAVSVSAAEAYYGSLGQNWERAAMIKARPVAGDRKAGQDFMGLIRHFIWRRSLDFAAIQDIHSIKRQIGAHKGHRDKAVNGHDIKLGRGGIREIEFFAQTQQLIYGGRDPHLRTPATMMALDALVAAGRVGEDAAEDLKAAYRFLRRVEHRVQMVDDQQTHKLPVDDKGVASIATFLGYADADTFRTELLATLGRVEDRYAALFEEAPPLSGPGNLVFTGTEDDPDTITTLRGLGFQNPSAVAAQIRAWHHGRYRATRSTRARELLTELVPTLLAALGGTAQPDQAFLKFDEFLSRLPAGVQLFSLFYANPKLLELVALIMGTAPRLADSLSRRPSQLDAVLTPGFFDHLPNAQELREGLFRQLADAHHFEEVLDLTRRWTSDQRLRAGIQILRHLTDGDQCGPFLTEVADTALTVLHERVEAEFALRHGRFETGSDDGTGMAILAMGRLGAGSLSLGSDLDLITVYQVPDGSDQSNGPKPLSPSEYFIRLTQRLINAITVPTAEGALYEVDMRLRPSGNKGPLAVSLDAFTRYQHESAWTWEHMALTRARVLTGPPALRTRLAEAIHAVLVQPRDPDKLLADVADMRVRMDKEHHTKDPWSVKHVRGGMVDIQFLVQYLTLRHAADHPGILDPNTTGALARLRDTGLLDAADADALIDIHRLWRRVQAFLRLTVEGEVKVAEAPPALRLALAEAVGHGLDFDAAEAKIRAAAAQAHALFRKVVEEPAARPPAPAP